MAKNHPLPVCSRAAFAATALLLGLVASPLACKSDSDDDASEDTTGDSASAPSPTVIRDRDDSPAAPSSGNVRDIAPAPAVDESATGAENPSAAGDGAADAPPMAAGAAAADDAITPPAAAAQTFEACSIAQGIYAGACNTIYVTMKQAAPALCVQLTIDNCGSYSRQGLSVDTPPSWRLASGSIGDTAAPCDLGAFYPDRTIAADASGSISWNLTTRRPSELVLDLTLERAGSAGEPASIDITTADPLEPGPCPE